ncbi:hypothetical protein FACS189451_01880 [Bacteroidia bacterium]|nr:hypothetical protein FACS189451_01880 [Bacteroidia bacterium]
MADLIDTDIFVVVENEEDACDFVTIDEDVPFHPIIIDMSDNEFSDAITIDFEENIDPDAFVTIDEEPIFLSGFTEDDLLN